MRTTLFIIFLSLTAQIASASTAVNVPLFLELPKQKLVDSKTNYLGAPIQSKHHLTLVFLQMDPETCAKAVPIIKEKIASDPELLQLAKRIKLRFKEFSLCGRHLSAVYEPVDSIESKGKDNNKAKKTYVRLVKKLRSIVRLSLEEVIGKPITTEDKFNRYRHPVEVVTPDESFIYVMDKRDPFPHVSLKKGAKKSDVEKLNSLLLEGELEGLKDIEIDLEYLKPNKTRPSKIFSFVD